MTPGFAVWVTGVPAAGKSTLTAALCERLHRRGVHPVVLESDALRQVLTPEPRYDEDERRLFYRAMGHMGRLLCEQGVPVVFDATANLRQYRAYARQHIPRFVEVFVDSPLRVCQDRDPKGIYRQAAASGGGSVPGVHVPYEPPERPEVTVHGADEDPDEAARRVIRALEERGYL